uniref:MobQ family relaxase n=1 Tax=Brucella pseudintermedia TaxID=370111 RepID=UPI00158876F0|nr:MobQ family relaxase [Brucella pseudintermedia]
MTAVAFHCQIKPHSRAKGHSSVAAAAYRAAVRMIDYRTGIVHDFSRKSGVEFSEIMVPANSPNWARDRAALWNAAEAKNTRVNSTVARDCDVAFPAGLDFDVRQRMIRVFVRALIDQHGCAADVAMHRPSRRGDARNFHAHVLLTTHRLNEDGFTEKTREFDERMGRGGSIITHWREQWAILCAKTLKRAGREIEADRWRWGFLTLSMQVKKAEERGDFDYVALIKGTLPTVHMGAAAKAEREGKRTAVGDLNRTIEKHNAEVINLAKVRAEKQVLEGVSTPSERAALVRKVKAAYNEEWKSYSEWNKAEIAKIYAEFSAPLKEAATRHRADTKPVWRHYYRWRRSNERAFAWRESSVSGLLRNAVDAAITQHRAGELDGRSLLSAIVVNIFSSRRRRHAIRALQNAKKDEVEASLKEVLNAELAEIKAVRAARLDAQKENAAQRRAVIKARQDAAWAEMREAYRELRNTSQAGTRQFPASRTEAGATVSNQSAEVIDRIETRPGERYTDALPYRHIVIVESAADAEAYLRLHPDLQKTPSLIVAVNGAQAALDGHMIDTLARQSSDPQTGLYASFRVAYGAAGDAAAERLEAWFAAVPRRIQWGVDRDRPGAQRWTDVGSAQLARPQLPKSDSGLDF